MCTIVFNISTCNLASLPPELAAVTTLKALVASHNALTSASLQHVTPLVNLNSLILSDNKLTSLPPSFSKLTSLKKLSVANNALTADALPDFSQMTALEEVRLNGNVGIDNIPESLGKAPQLALLELSHTCISDFKQLHKLAPARYLINLGLRGTKLAESAKYQDRVTTALPGLRILDNNRFDAKYLERKEKAREKAVAELEKADAKEAKSGKKASDSRSTATQQVEQAATPVKRKKRKLVGEDAVDGSESGVSDGKTKSIEAVKPTRKKRKRLDVTSDEGDVADEATSVAVQEAGEEDANTAEPRKRKRKKRQEKEEQGEEASIISQKAPKAVGGSLSEPQSELPVPVTADAPVEADGEAASRLDGAREAVGKTRSAVVGIVDVRKDAKRGNKSRKAVRQEAHLQREEPADLFAVLAGEASRDKVVHGWD